MDSDTSPGALEGLTHKRQHLSLPAPFLSEAGPRDFTSTCRLQPLLLDAPGLQFLDPYGDSEDTPGHSSYSFKDCFLGSVHCNVPSHTPKSRSPEEVNLEDPLSLKIPDLVKKAAGWAPASLGANDVDMQPVEASGAEARGWAARLPGAPEDTRMIGEVGGSKAASPLLPAAGAPQTGRHTQGRARVSQQVPRPPPRLGSERDKGPRLSLSKRKLELLLPEPEKSKRKRQYVA
nr:PREDICTED: uncharacterized protein LOC103556445 isoform X3 [Equus przewalskii]XP_008526788.1 PREDICTED: uncharacterized protein LOC103556445 isoform X3 [Equus przewalskii]